LTIENTVGSEMKKMKMVLRVLCIAAASSSCQAAWLEIGANETGTFYVDPPTIQRSGDIVKMWYLVDFKSTQVDTNTKSFLSSKDQSEYDCKQERSRSLYYNNYSEKMGSGKIIFTLKDALQWRPTGSGTIAAALLKIACSKK